MGAVIKRINDILKVCHCSKFCMSFQAGTSLNYQSFEHLGTTGASAPTTSWYSSSDFVPIDDYAKDGGLGTVCNFYVVLTIILCGANLFIW